MAKQCRPCSLLLQERSDLGLHCLILSFCQKHWCSIYHTVYSLLLFNFRIIKSDVKIDDDSSKKVCNIMSYHLHYVMLLTCHHNVRSRLITSVHSKYTVSGNQGPVVQSVLSLMSTLRVISLTVLVDSIYNILIFFAEKSVSSFCTAKATHIFSAKKFSIFAYHSM